MLNISAYTHPWCQNHGWRRNNWKAPTVIERFRPDKVEFRLTMQSLIQPEVITDLNKCLGIETQSLSSQTQTILALALTERYVTNERLRYILRIHKSDITILLQQMCRQRLLISDGYGRGTKYRLAGKISDSNVDSLSSNVDSFNTNVDSSNPNVDSLSPNVDSSSSNVDSSKNNLDEFQVNYNPSATARLLLKKKRLTKTEMETLFYDIALQWRTIQELTRILGKDTSYLRNHVLPSLISKGILEREYPSILNHPNQRYRIKQS